MSTTSEHAETPLVAADDIVAVTQEVWSALLGLDLTPDCSNAILGTRLTGCVQITGAWEGAVLLTCPEDLARVATQAMFASDDVSEEDIVDAVGELTNMVGGSVKSLLPAPSQLSVPSVTTGQSYDLHLPGAVPMHHVMLGCGPQPIEVSVWHA